MANCAICKELFADDRSLHAHLKAHKLRMVEYYQTYYPRYDLHTKEIILFKNKEQYFAEDFNNRLNLKAWLKSVSVEEARDYLKQSLLTRKEKKNLKFSPTQIELRSLIAAPIQYYQKVFGDYHEMCSSIGFENRFNIYPQGEIIQGKKYSSKDHSIFVDTREQTPLRFNSYPIEIRTLNYGDYSFSDSKASCDCFIERKSLNDFLGTLSGGFERFKNEIERANSDGAYLVVVVERSFNDCRAFNHLSEIKRKLGKIKITPDYIFHNVRDLLQTYKNLQFLFVDGRGESVRVIEKIFTSGCVYRQLDLQLAYDLKVL